MTAVDKKVNKVKLIRNFTLCLLLILTSSTFNKNAQASPASPTPNFCVGGYHYYSEIVFDGFMGCIPIFHMHNWSVPC